MAQAPPGMWVISPEDKSKHETVFNSLNPVNGKLTGDQAKKYFMKSNLPTPTLGQIWMLSDLDGDGKMTLQEFSIGVHLIQARLRGIEIPTVLPLSLRSSSVPLSKPAPGMPGSSWSHAVVGSNASPMSNGFATKPIGTSVFSQQPMVGSYAPPASSTISQPLNYSGGFGVLGTAPTMQPLQATSMPGMAMTRANTWGQRSTASVAGPVNWQTQSVKMPHSSSTPQFTPTTKSGGSFGDLAIGMIPSPQTSSSSSTSNLNTISPANRLKYTQMFKAADHEQSGLLKGEHARQLLIQSNVPPQKLAGIWELSDLNKDGSLDLDEFIIAMHLIEVAKSGQALPQTVPPELIPPNKKMQSGDASGDGRNRSESNLSGRERSLSIGSAAGDRMNPATFEDRRKENFEKGRLELERRRKELQDKQIREKEERERKEREEEERKRRVREEAERRRQQDLENERRQREEMEREQENMRKKMIEQRLQAQLESERQRQREWEQRRKEELVNLKEHEEEVVAGLKARLEKLKAELNMKTSNRNQLAASAESKKAEGLKLMESITMCDRLSEVKKSEIVQLQSEIQQSRVAFSSLKEERERLTVEINKRDTTTTSEALGGVRSSILQMRNEIPRLKSSLLTLEAEAVGARRETETNHHQLKALKDNLRVKMEENSHHKHILEQKKREYMMFRQRVEEEHRRKKEDEEMQRREQEARRKKEDQLRKQLEEEARKQKQREQAAMALEEQHQLESLRRVQEVQQADRRRKMEEAKKQAEEALKKQLELKKKDTERVPVPAQRSTPDLLAALPSEPVPPIRPAPRKDKKAAPPRPTAPPRPPSAPKTSLSELSDLFSSLGSPSDNSVPLSKGGASDIKIEADLRKRREEELAKELQLKTRQEEERKRDEERIRIQEEEIKRREEDLRRREEEQKKREEEQRKREDEQRKREEEQRKREEEQRRKAEEQRREEEELKRKQDESKKRQEIEKLAREEEEKKKAEQQAEVKRKIEEMQQKKMEKKMAQQTHGYDKVKPAVPVFSTTNLLPKYKLLFPFEARNADELTLKENDIVQVDEHDPSAPQGWLRGTCKGKSGLFPANYAEKLPPDSNADYVDLDPKAFISQKAPVTEHAVTSASSEDLYVVPSSIKVQAAASPQAQSSPKTKPKLDLLSKLKPSGKKQKETASSEQSPSPYSSHKEEKSADDSSDYVSMTEAFDVDLVATSKASDSSKATDRPNSLHIKRESYENFQLNVEKTPPPQAGTEVTLAECLVANALYSYRGKKEDQLTFNKNDVISVSKQQDMWWFGECAGKSGWFPKSYVKVTGKTPSVSDANENTIGDAKGTVDDSSSELLGVTNKQLSASNENILEEAVMLGECVALFDYNGQEGDLHFCEGDIISISKKESDWWEGYCNGRYGLFPANYVQIKEPELVKKKPEVATVLSPFTASGPTEISLSSGNLIHVIRKNPSGWWQGELQAKGKKRQVGWFPASHVKLLGQAKVKDPLPATEPDQEDLYAVPQKATKSQTEPSEQVLAIFSYTAQNEDELTFYKGSVINVINKEGEWWKGEFNGQVGMFPSNYVQLLSDLPDTTSEWYGSFDSAVLESMNETERFRQNYIYELINTEQRYMDDLSLTLDIFYNPMAEAKILVQEELNTVFVNWKELIMCNMKLLKAMLVRKKMSPSEKIEAIGDILVEQLPRLTPYIRFCSCQLKACKYLQFKVENDPEFKAFEKKCAGDQRLHQNLPLSSYLLKPLQRLTKYPLMIKQILRYTPSNHYDRNNLELAVEKAEELCSKVNENIRLLENSERLEWLQSHVVLENLGEKLVFNSHTNCLGQRKFLHYSTLFKHKSNKELKAFLFNDFVLLCRDHGSNAKARPFSSLFISADEKDSAMQLTLYKKPIFLNEIVVKMPSEPEVTDMLFHLSHIDRIYTFRAESKSERNAWVSKLQRASEEFIETERLQRQKASRARSVLGNGVGKLIVTVIEGADLHSSDPTGTSDPYCEVSMGSQEHKTKVIPKNLNPKWNSQMQFTIKDFTRDVLCITVFDRDFFSPNDFLGRTEVPIASLLAEGNGPWSKRLLLHEVDTGEILVRLEIHKFQI